MTARPTIKFHCQRLCWGWLRRFHRRKFPWPRNPACEIAARTAGDVFFGPRNSSARWRVALRSVDGGALDAGDALDGFGDVTRAVVASHAGDAQLGCGWRGHCFNGHRATTGAVRRISFSARAADGLHAAMPSAQVRQRLRQPVMAGKKKIFHHAEQVEIHEQRMFAEEKPRMREHLFTRPQLLLKLGQAVPSAACATGQCSRARTCAPCGGR